MIRNFLFTMAALPLGGVLPAQAELRILATTAVWGALATELGGDKVNVYTATTALQHVHQVNAKPSLVARARNADLVVATGAELEMGWLPVLLQESGNPKIQPGYPGYFEATSAVRLVDVPTSVDRAMGDLHAQGNPHIQLDPRNIAAVATALTARLASIDPAIAQHYQSRGADFQGRWAAAIEPKPGVPPSAGYLAELVSRLSASPPKMILRNAYNDPQAADWLSQRIKAPVVMLPFSVGGTPEAKDLFGLFDDTLNRLLAAAK
jgi:zinc/manganese transport system substrate-binding protein